jgi:hypothetical protein
VDNFVDSSTQAPPGGGGGRAGPGGGRAGDGCPERTRRDIHSLIVKMKGLLIMC